MSTGPICSRARLSYGAPSASPTARPSIAPSALSGSTAGTLTPATRDPRPASPTCRPSLRAAADRPQLRDRLLDVVVLHGAHAELARGGAVHLEVVDEDALLGAQPVARP